MNLRLGEIPAGFIERWALQNGWSQAQLLRYIVYLAVEVEAARIGDKDTLAWIADETATNPLARIQSQSAVEAAAQQAAPPRTRAAAGRHTGR